MNAPRTISPAEQFLSRLEGVRPTGPGRWLARCPAHEDKRPSLSIREAEDGRVLVHCFAGCGTLDEVLPAVGLRAADLFERPLDHRAGRPRIARPSGAEVMAILGQEAVLLRVAFQMLIDAEEFTDEDIDRISEGIARIDRVREAFRDD